MITYLAHGWYTSTPPTKLRDEVVDGAIEAASMLFSAGLGPQSVEALAMRVRSLVAITDPPHRRLASAKAPGFTEAEHRAIEQRLRAMTDGAPPLQSFILDCLDHVTETRSLQALYLHMMHITHMMQLLQVARLTSLEPEGEVHQVWTPSSELVQHDLEAQGQLRARPDLGLDVPSGPAKN